MKRTKGKGIQVITYESVLIEAKYYNSRVVRVLRYNLWKSTVRKLTRGENKVHTRELFNNI